MAGPNQIFYDPTGSRKRIVNVACVSIVLTSVAMAAVVAIGMLIAPKLPSIGDVRAERLTSVERGITGWNPASPGFSLLSSRPISAAGASVRRFAFFNMMEAESHASLRLHAADLDGLLPDFLMISGRDGRLVQQDPSIEGRLRRWMRANSPALEIYPVLSIGPDPSKGAAYLEFSVVRAQLVASIAHCIGQNGDAGVTVDLSNLPPSFHLYAVSLLSELADAIHPSGKKVVIEISVTSERSRVQELARFADLVVLNTYSDSDQRDQAGPIASQGWFESQLEAVFAIVPSSKVIVGIGSFARDFDGSQQHGVTSVQNAFDLLANANALLRFDQQALSPRFSFTSANGVTHEIWMLDGVTVFNQLRAALSKAPAGVGLWRLGLEDPSAWASFAKGRLPDDKAISELKEPQPGYVRLDGNAHLEFAGLQSQAKRGNRSISFNAPAGLTVLQTLERFPLDVNQFSHRGIP